MLILTADDRFPPFSVVKIPLYRLFDAVLELRFRQPAQLIVDFRWIDGVAHIMPFAVADMRD